MLRCCPPAPASSSRPRRVARRGISAFAAAMDWPALRERAAATPVGARLAEEAALRAVGEGLPSKDARLRLFGGKESDVRVVLYRDRCVSRVRRLCGVCLPGWQSTTTALSPRRSGRCPLRSLDSSQRRLVSVLPEGLAPVRALPRGAGWTALCQNAVHATLTSAPSADSFDPGWRRSAFRTARWRSTCALTARALGRPPPPV